MSARLSGGRAVLLAPCERCWALPGIARAGATRSRSSNRSGEASSLSAEPNDEFITLARVVKTQGRHGEVAVEVHIFVAAPFTESMKLQALDRSEARRELQVENLWP